MNKSFFPSWKKGISLLLGLIIFAIPLLAYQAETQNAIREAELQAKTDANGTLWLIAGCLGSVLGILIGQLIEPKPPQSALLGKSSEYVAAYTDAYVRSVKKIRLNNSLIGCGISGAAEVLLYVLVIAAATTTTTYY